MTWETLIDNYRDDSERETKKLRFAKLRDLIAANLYYSYQVGKLKWPRPRPEINEENNQIVRRLFPLGGEL
jgi:hypothetical protein